MTLLFLWHRWIPQKTNMEVAKEMHELIGSLTNWVYTTSDVMNVVAVSWRVWRSLWETF